MICSCTRGPIEIGDIEDYRRVGINRALHRLKSLHMLLIVKKTSDENGNISWLLDSWLVVWLPFFIFPYIGFLIIPIDFHIFQRGSKHQPDSRFNQQHLLFKSSSLVKLFQLAACKGPLLIPRLQSQKKSWFSMVNKKVFVQVKHDKTDCINL